MDSQITEDIYSPADLERIARIDHICDFILSDLKNKVVGKDLYLSFNETLLQWSIRDEKDEIIISTEDIHQAVAYFTYLEETKESKKFNASDLITTVVGNWMRYARKKDGRLSGTSNSA
jgi:hypothetical protein